MNAHSAKDWKSFDEQIDILRSRGMIIDDEARAKRFLWRVGYYRLSGYWYSFRQLDPETGKRLDDFVEGSRFSDVIALYNFDRKLKLLALDAIERIELAVQVEIAYLLGARDPFAHENPNELHGKFSRKTPGEKLSPYQQWQKDYRRLVKRSDQKAFVRHHLNKYKKIPIWAAVEVFDFGTMSKLYSGMKHQDKLRIEAQFGLNEGKHFETWLRGLNFIRNTAAHHSRLWNCNVLELASIPRTNPKLFSLKNTRPFLYFCMMQTILRVICPEAQWGQRFIELMNSFPNVGNKAVSTNDMGAVEGWKDWSLWR